MGSEAWLTSVRHVFAQRVDGQPLDNLAVNRMARLG